MHTDYIGFDVHKRTISFCVKDAAGQVLEQGVIPATRAAVTAWAKRRPRPWRGALEATLFSGWVYDELRPYAAELKVAHPAMLKAITAAKKKNDRVDTDKITDLLRCNLLPECYMAPGWVREQRRLLRYRNRVVQQAVRLKNRISGLLMEDGQVYDQRRLHGKRYFYALLERLQTPASILQLLRLSRGTLELLQMAERRLIHQLRNDPRLHLRVRLLMSIRGVGEVLALTWALEIAEVQRFSSIRKACSYCGLTSAQHNSAGQEQRGPISKQRNPHLQTILIEAAKLAPRWNPELAALHQRELARGNRNRATLAVARKLVAYLMAVDRSGQPFQPRSAVAGAATVPTEAGPAGPEFSQAGGNLSIR
ncbi:MAG: IS110 family transposase [bacterium]